MVQFAAALLRGVIATFVGLLIAGGTLTLAADRAPVQRPTLVPVAPGPVTLTVPDVSAQAYVFAKGILQDHGFAWHVSGPVQGYAANTVALQRPPAGTVVLDTGAPTITLTLARNPAYIEKGTPENDAPYAGTAIELPASVPARPQTTVIPRLEPVPIPVSPTVNVPVTIPTPATTPTPVTNPVTTPAVTPPAQTTPSAAAPVRIPATTTPPPVTPTPTTTPTTPPPAPSAPSGPRTPEFAVPGAPKEPERALSLPDRVAALAVWIEGHHEPNATNLNHWLYEHAFVVAGARFGWWHGADALEELIAVDRRAEALWGVGTQSRTSAEKALAEVRSRGA
jgi:hypothetical protein